ncbi:MAG: hypothetical protein IJZ44_01045 [Lachnospiraceae bacterium]|nr:hypothetical protein [Lachnospiraceae bacterium]
MQMSRDKNKIITILLFLILFALSVVGIWKTVYFSADIDESYALTMAHRIVVGDRMMTDMWEPHQMSAVLYAPLVALYKSISGSMEGALVFMRICGVLIQGCIGVFLYYTIRKKLPHMLSMVLAFAYFNFTPKHIQSPEFTVLFYWAIMVLMLALLLFFDTEKKDWMILAGLSLSVIVLCYPAAILLFVYTVGLLIKKKQKKACVHFALTCVFCGVLFIVYLIITSGGLDVFSNISYILMDESHTQSMTDLFVGHLKGIWDMLVVILVVMVLCHMGRLICFKKKGADRLFFGLLLLFMGGYALYQFHTIEKVNFTIIYPIALQLFVLECYAYITFPQKEEDRLWFAVSMFLNLIGVVVILFTSNVLTQYSMSFFMPSVILGVRYIYGIYNYQESDECREKKYNYTWMAIFLCVCVIVQIFATRILLVRFTATRRKNIFEYYYEVNHDVLKGVRLGDLDYAQYETKSALFKKYVEEGDVFLYVGSDMFLYTQFDGMRIGSGNTISTPAFAEQLMCYYENNPDRIPNVVFVDREYCADFSQFLLQEPMKTFMETYFDVENATVETAITVYQRER